MANYSTEEDVYQATGYNSDIVQKLGSKTSAEVTTMINDFISKSDLRIKRALGVPITIRKEWHSFDYSNDFVELGPHEDPLDVFGTYVSKDCIEEVFAVYRAPYAYGNMFGGSGRVKLPYPKNCDDFTEDITDMNAGSKCTLSKETTIKRCGNASIKVIMAVGGNASSWKFDFPKNHFLNKNIETWDYIGFWFRTMDKTAIFTIKLYDIDGNSTSQTFTAKSNDAWEIIALYVEAMAGYTECEWNEDRYLQYIEISADKACTFYIDNFCFNDGFFWTYPEGLVCWCDPITEQWGNVEVTYSYDPYKISTPEDIKQASAKLAGVYLIDYLIGCRQRVTGFQQMAEDFDIQPDRDTLEVTRARLLKEYNEILAGTGFKTYSGLGLA